MKSILSTAALIASIPAIAQTEFYKVSIGELEQATHLFGVVKPVESVDLRPNWMSLITSFHVRVGDSVKKGDLVATGDNRFATSALANARSMLQFYESADKQARDALDREKKQFARMKRLVDRGIEPKSKMTDLQKALLDAESRVMSSKFSLDSANERIKQAEERAKQTNFYAPIDGQVVQMDFNPDQLTGAVYARNSHLLARIVVPGEYEVEAIALDTQVGSLRVGDVVEVHFAGLSRPISGTVKSIEAVDLKQNKDATAGEFAVTVSVKTDLELPSTSRARIRVSRSSKAGVLIPWSAIRSVADKNVVKMADGSQRQVSICCSNAHYVMVDDGVTDGEEIEVKLW